MINGPNGKTDSRVNELFSGVRNEFQQVIPTVQNFIGSFLGGN